MNFGFMKVSTLALMVCVLPLALSKSVFAQHQDEILEVDTAPDAGAVVPKTTQESVTPVAPLFETKREELIDIKPVQTLEPSSPRLYGQGPASVADLAQGLLDAVVNVSTKQSGKGNDSSDNIPKPKLPDGSPFKEYFDEFFQNRGNGGSSQPANSLGSGFVIDAQEGIIITNYHVIEDADSIEVNFTNGDKLAAQLVGVDKKTDLAVLKVDPKKHKLVAVPFGDSKTMRIGDWVMAIGNPFGLGGSVSVGIISAINRDIKSGPYDDFIQTDAAINRGNSGGPLFNMAGEVIGINTAIISPSGGSIGIGFSIPSKLALRVIGQLREFGQTRRGWLGVRMQPVNQDIAESLGLDSVGGVMVAGVVKGGPVDDGSILAGDILVEFDGELVKSLRDLRRFVAESPVAKKVKVKLFRKGKEMMVDVTLGQLEEGEKLAQASASESEDDSARLEKGKLAPKATALLGMTLASISEDLRQRFDIASQVNGVVIVELGRRSQAAERGIQEGDIIVEIGQEAVLSPSDVAKRFEKLKENGRENALLMISSPSGELRFVTLNVTQ